MTEQVVIKRRSVFAPNQNHSKTPTLYYDDVNPASRMCLMLLELMNVPVEQKAINTLEAKPISSSIDSINIVYYVPTFVHDTMTLTSCHAILIYICEEWGQQKKNRNYLPPEFHMRMRVLNRLFFNDSIALKRHSELMTNIIRNGYENIDHDFHRRRILKLYETLEMYLQENNFLSGHVLTLSDIAMVATVGALDLYIPIEDVKNSYPKFYAWFENLRALPMYKVNAKGLKKQRAVLESFGEFKFPNQRRESMLSEQTVLSNTRRSSNFDKIMKGNEESYSNNEFENEHNSATTSSCKCSSKAKTQKEEQQSPTIMGCKCSSKTKAEVQDHPSNTPSGCKCSSQAEEEELKISTNSCCKCSSKPKAEEEKPPSPITSGCKCSSQAEEELKIPTNSCCKCSSKPKAEEEKPPSPTTSGCKCSSQAEEEELKIPTNSCCKCSSKPKAEEEKPPSPTASGCKCSSQAEEDMTISTISGCQCSSKPKAEEVEQPSPTISGCKCSSQAEEEEVKISTNSCCKCSSKLKAEEEEEQCSTTRGCKCSHQAEIKDEPSSATNGCKCSSKSSSFNTLDRNIKEENGTNYCKCSAPQERRSTIEDHDQNCLEECTYSCSSKKRSPPINNKPINRDDEAAKNDLNTSRCKCSSSSSDIIKTIPQCNQTCTLTNKGIVTNKVDVQGCGCRVHKTEEEGCNFVIAIKNSSEKKKRFCKLHSDKSAEKCRDENQENDNEDNTNVAINIGVTCTESPSKTTICTTVFSIKPQANFLGESGEYLPDSWKECDCDLNELNKNDDEDYENMCAGSCHKCVGCNFNGMKNYNNEHKSQMGNQYERKIVRRRYPSKISNRDSVSG